MKTCFYINVAIVGRFNTLMTLLPPQTEELHDVPPPAAIVQEATDLETGIKLVAKKWLDRVSAVILEELDAGTRWDQVVEKEASMERDKLMREKDIRITEGDIEIYTKTYFWEGENFVKDLLWVMCLGRIRIQELLDLPDNAHTERSQKRKAWTYDIQPPTEDITSSQKPADPYRDKIYKARGKNLVVSTDRPFPMEALTLAMSTQHFLPSPELWERWARRRIRVEVPSQLEI